MREIYSWGIFLGDLDVICFSGWLNHPVCASGIYSLDTFSREARELFASVKWLKYVGGDSITL